MAASTQGLIANLNGEFTKRCENFSCCVNCVSKVQLPLQREITLSETRKALKELKSKKATGIDGIPSRH